MKDFIFKFGRGKHFLNLATFQFDKEIIIGDNSLHLKGDPICSELSALIDPDFSVEQLLEIVKGHYYFIYSEGDFCQIGNSRFSILPMYYAIDNGSVYVSNKVKLIAQKLSSVTTNKRFILENILFNYPLFNQTISEEIQLLPSNSYLQIKSGSVEVKSLKPIEEYFVSNPKPWRKSIDEIGDIFIEKSAQYFPDEEYATSLTGGFDGRTLTALGKYHGKSFSTYCFGSKKSADVQIAKKLSALSGLRFHEFDLGRKYVEDRSLHNGLEFITGAEGGASFARAHYMDAIRQLSKEYKYIVTGNFGSEVFRAAHIAGVVISPNLYKLFTALSFDEGIKGVESSNEFLWLKKEAFREEWRHLKIDLKKLPCFAPQYKELTKNQQFYKFVFEEIFRKYFGAEMANQYQYIINRTPFLDFDFIQDILKTELSGVYSGFFENNPVKRYKGQVVYANIIKKAYPDFGTELTDKGYRPDDLLTIPGKLRIVQGYVKKRIKKSKRNRLADPYSVQAAFAANKSFWKKFPLDEKLFDVARIQAHMETLSHRDSLFIVLSQNYYLHQMTGQYANI